MSPVETPAAVKDATESASVTKPAAAAVADPAVAPAAVKAAPVVVAADAAVVKPGEAAAVTDETPATPVTYTLKVPEGSEAWLDAADLTNIAAIAKTQDWTQEEAQAALEAHADTLVQQSLTFRAQTEAHALYGGEHLAETQRLAGLVMDRFAPKGDALGDELRRDLTKSGYANKLSVVSFMARLGKAMSEDTLTGSAQTSAVRKSTEERLYGPDKPAT